MRLMIIISLELQTTTITLASLSMDETLIHVVYTGREINIAE